MTKIIKIVIADDEQLFRQGIKNILDNEEDLKVVHDLENGQALIEKLRAARSLPEIVITDLKMPELNGVEVTKIITKEFPKIKIIALTSYFTKPFILNMISIGAVAYLAKNSTPDLMLKTIRAVSRNGFYYDREVQKYVDQLHRDKHKINKSPLDEKLFTKRELQVLDLICKQYQANDIAQLLTISRRTVEQHRRNLMFKSQCKNVAGLVVYAIKHQLVSLDDK